MKIHEYQAMALFAEYGINTVPCELAEKAEVVADIAKRLGGNVAVKAQVLVGGRGKSGGVKLAHSPEEAEKLAGEIFSLQIKSMPVKKVLIARAVEIQKEYYLGITVDGGMRKIVFMASAAGGVEIEELAKQSPEKIHKLYVKGRPFGPPLARGMKPRASTASVPTAMAVAPEAVDHLTGPSKAELQRMLSNVFKEPGLVEEATETLLKMYRLFLEKDCSLVEINPFVQTRSDTLVAIDAKINFDDNGLFKHPEIEQLRNPEECSPDEIRARAAGLSFVSMDGNIGCIVNGAGLAMATMDVIKLFGGEAANFLDVGGSSNPSKVLNALEIIISNRKVKAILINIFGGITRCDDIANGILMAADKIDIKVPLVIRLIGTNEAEGREILKKAGYVVADHLVEAVKKVVALV